MTAQRLKREFENRFGSRYWVYCSPGRVNLIGDHTDYNLGYVLPGAIDKAIYTVIGKSDNDFSRFYSLDYDAEIKVDLKGPKPDRMWASFIYGVVKEMEKRGAVIGNFDCAFGGDVPLGAGLSSSAALESAFGFALNDLYGAGFDRKELAVIGQMTEHNYIGVRCGIMDQFASLFGEEGKVIKLDCRDLDYELVPFDPEGCRVVLIDSMVKHSLASSEYNVRREQCEAGVEMISGKYPKVKSLRDVTLAMLEEYRERMDPVVYRRCRYVLEENERVLKGCEALKRGDYEEFGRNMYGSHDGLSKEYEVSCPELDLIVSVARTHSCVLGARMMGGGFGGCVISLVKDEDHDSYLADVKEKFQEHYGVEPRIIEVVIGAGARKLE